MEPLIRITDHLTPTYAPTRTIEASPILMALITALTRALEKFNTKE